MLYREKIVVYAGARSHHCRRAKRLLRRKDYAF